GTNLPSALRYDAFGNRSATGGTDPFDSTDFQFAGGFGYQTEYASATEPGLGLEYLEQRYYDPAVGRFISADPIGFAGGLNLYAYVENNPIAGIDPSGLRDEDGNPESYRELILDAQKKAKQSPELQPGSKERVKYSNFLDTLPVIGQLKAA